MHTLIKGVQEKIEGSHTTPTDLHECSQQSAQTAKIEGEISVFISLSRLCEQIYQEV